MKTLVRASILLAAACGFCFALSLAAQADVVEPTSAYQPASTGLLSKGAPAGAGLPAAVAEESKPKAEPKVEEAKIEPVAVAATPAPEQQVVRQVPTTLSPQAGHGTSSSLIDHVVHPLRIGVEHLKTTLGRVVSACEVGFGTGAGGPVLVLGVLSMAIPFIRRRIFAIRWATDEVVPEFRYVWELTPPG